MSGFYVRTETGGGPLLVLSVDKRKVNYDTKKPWLVQGLLPVCPEDGDSAWYTLGWFATEEEAVCQLDDIQKWMTGEGTSLIAYEYEDRIIHYPSVYDLRERKAGGVPQGLQDAPVCPYCGTEDEDWDDGALSASEPTEVQCWCCGKWYAVTKHCKFETEPAEEGDS